MACIHWHKLRHKLTKCTKLALIFFTVFGARTFLWLKFLVSIKWRCSLKTRLLKLRCSVTPRSSNAWIQLRLFCILSTCVDGAMSRFIQRFSIALSRHTWHALNTFNTIHKPSINDHVNYVEDNHLIPGGQICCRQNGGSWLRGEGLQTCSLFSFSFVALMLSLSCIQTCICLPMRSQKAEAGAQAPPKTEAGAQQGSATNEPHAVCKWAVMVQ